MLDKSVLFFFQQEKKGIVSLRPIILGTKRFWGRLFVFWDGGGLLVYFLYMLFVLPEVQLILRKTIH